VVETVEGNLAQGMRQLNGVYTQYVNRAHGRVGHVFQGRVCSGRATHRWMVMRWRVAAEPGK
jgi:hypothetical protein